MAMMIAIKVTMTLMIMMVVTIAMMIVIKVAMTLIIVMIVMIIMVIPITSVMTKTPVNCVHMIYVLFTYLLMQSLFIDISSLHSSWYWETFMKSNCQIAQLLMSKYRQKSDQFFYAMSDFCENCNPHIIPPPLVNVWLVFDLPKHVSWLCLHFQRFLSVWKMRVYCMLKEAVWACSIVCMSGFQINSVEMHCTCHQL